LAPTGVGARAGVPLPAVPPDRRAEPRPQGTLEAWCRANLHGGFIVVPEELSSAELIRKPLRRSGVVLFTVNHPRGGGPCRLIAQKFAARKASAAGVRWRVGLNCARQPAEGAGRAGGGGSQPEAGRSRPPGR
jgi:hypothetical protein